MTNQVQNNQAPVGSSAPAASGGDAPFDPDAAVLAALQQQISMIDSLTSDTLSMQGLDSSIQETGVQNAASKVSMYKHLLEAAGNAESGKDLKNVIGGYQAWLKKNPKETANEASFKAFLDSKDPTGKLEKEYLGGIEGDSTMTQADKDTFAQLISKWPTDSKTFASKQGELTPLLSQSSTAVQNWQSLGQSFQPTQLQQAIVELLSQIGSESNIQTDIVGQ